jgi:hypothetical protein
MATLRDSYYSWNRNRVICAAKRAYEINMITLKLMEDIIARAEGGCFNTRSQELIERMMSGEFVSMNSLIQVNNFLDNWVIRQAHGAFNMGYINREIMNFISLNVINFRFATAELKSLIDKSRFVKNTNSSFFIETNESFVINNSSQFYLSDVLNYAEHNEIRKMVTDGYFRFNCKEIYDYLVYRKDLLTISNEKRSNNEISSETTNVQRCCEPKASEPKACDQEVSPRNSRASKSKRVESASCNVVEDVAASTTTAESTSSSTCPDSNAKE